MTHRRRKTLSLPQLLLLRLITLISYNRLYFACFIQDKNCDRRHSKIILRLCLNSQESIRVNECVLGFEIQPVALTTIFTLRVGRKLRKPVCCFT